MLRGAKSTSQFRNASASTTGASNGSSLISRSGSVGAVSSLWPSNTANDAGLHQNLGLHNAAATGNLGLVKFALDNGQPHTSILNGLTPLHAACSGGSEAVVRLLLNYGADVNATRVKTPKGAGMGSMTGTEGSTPLHFAAANGHLAVVRLLLESGARPTAKDKDGLTPEALASSQGHSACASLLRLWITSYGPNGLAGLTTSSSSTFSSCSQDQSNFLTASSLRSQRSFDQLSSAAAGVKATLRNHKKQALAKVCSNPNLKSSTSNPSFMTTPPLPPPMPVVPSDVDLAASTRKLPSQSLSSSSTVPNQLRQSKRRPSLPTKFDRASHPSNPLRTTLLIRSPTASHNQSIDSIEELSLGGTQRRVNGSAVPPPSPIRKTYRLSGKRSLFGNGSTAQEQAQAILRTAEGDSSSPTTVDGTTITLTQMLASYGEALAQERKESSTLKIRKQASIASFGSSHSRHHQLPSVIEHIQTPSSSESVSATSNKVTPGSLTPFSTPPDSPQMRRSRAESSATNFSRSSPSTRPNVPFRGGKEIFTEQSGSTFPSSQLPTPKPALTSNQSISPKMVDKLELQDKRGDTASSNYNREVESPWSEEMNFRLNHRKDGLEKVTADDDDGGIPPSLPDTTAQSVALSLPADPSRFSPTSVLLPSESYTSRPHSSGRKRSSNRRPTTADSLSSLDNLNINRSGAISNDVFSQSSHTSTAQTSPSSSSRLLFNKNESCQDLRSTTGQSDATTTPHYATNFDGDSYQVGSTSSASLGISGGGGGAASSSTSKLATNKQRKGAVKAFLNGIKNNVVK
ncbi:hypothetical protein CBS101457_001227 [Exobasidium rhododendri]|nr:hypothetical protein CBS101457_001227 [Exobasidium rhododendri]